MKELGDFLIKTIAANTVPGPHKFGPLTDTVLALLKKAGNNYVSYYSVLNGKVTLTRPIPKDVNIVSIMIAPYLADDVGKSPFAKAEAEYIFKKMKNKLSKKEYESGINMITNYDEFTDKEREEYENYKKIFSNI